MINHICTIIPRQTYGEVLEGIVAVLPRFAGVGTHQIRELPTVSTILVDR